VRQRHAAGGSLSQSTQTLPFDLGEYTGVDGSEMRWPGQVKPERLDNPASNTLHKRAEPRSESVVGARGQPGIFAEGS